MCFVFFVSHFLTIQVYIFNSKFLRILLFFLHFDLRCLTICFKVVYFISPIILDLIVVVVVLKGFLVIYLCLLCYLFSRSLDFKLKYSSFVLIENLDTFL